MGFESLDKGNDSQPRGVNVVFPATLCSTSDNTKRDCIKAKFSNRSHHLIQLDPLNSEARALLNSLEMYST